MTGIQFMNDVPLQKAVAHHEAAHAVLAAVHGLVLMEDGIYMDHRSGALTLNRDFAPGNVCTDRERKASIVVCYAGKHAHMKQFGSELGCWTQDDADKARNHAEAMQPASYDVLDNILKEGYQEAKRSVEQYWTVIDAVADALVEKQWTNEDVGRYALENPVKHLSGHEVKAILERFGVFANIQE